MPEIFLGAIRKYLVYFLAGLTLVFGVGWYVSALQLEGQRARAEKVSAQLEVSNASYVSIRDQFKNLTKTLEDNQQAMMTKQTANREALLAAIEKEKPSLKLESELLTRKPTDDCKTPEDLKNAWNRL